jgi:hypothetical protein
MEMIYSKQVNFMGRNGYFKCKGLMINHLHNEQSEYITIIPITSKGFTGNCMVDIPKEDIKELIKYLEEART